MEYTYGKGLDPQQNYYQNKQNLGTSLITNTAQALTNGINKTTATFNKAKEVVGNLALPGANLGTIAYGQAPSQQPVNYNKSGTKFNYFDFVV